MTMIVMFTDFGARGPYVGQMQAVLAREAPGVPVINLFNDAPTFDPLASAYLLAAYVEEFPLDTIFLGVVDPGVGSAERKPVMLQVDGRWFVGPDNGLFEVVAQRAAVQGALVRWREIDWRPAQLSNSFHGRDLFAPVAASLARGEVPASHQLEERPVFDGPEDFPHIIYVDAFGNLITGLRAATIPTSATLRLGDHVLDYARTFAEVPVGQGFWYANANGLVEVALNQGRAAAVLHAAPGDAVVVQDGEP
jgi:hypothetical protein